jgi:hypothetical protein
MGTHNVLRTVAALLLLGCAAAANFESCTWIGSSPTGTNCHFMPILDCYTSGGVTAVRYSDSSPSMLYPASFSQAVDCRDWPPSIARPLPFSFVNQNTLISYTTLSSSHVAMGWRYPATGTALVDCTIQIRVSRAWVRATCTASLATVPIRRR